MTDNLPTNPTNASDGSSAQGRSAADTHLVAVSFFPLDLPRGETEELERILSETEQTRAGRFKFDLHRQRYVVAHARLRQLLSRRLERLPEKIRIGVAKGGKPFVAEPETSLEFSLSHSDGLGAVALSHRLPVGVDVERERTATEGLAQRYFAPEEAAMLAALPDPQRQPAFFRCWTGKEAVLKATGEGIRRGLDSFVLALAANGAIEMVSIDGCKDRAAHWQLCQVAPTEGFHGAVAVETQKRLEFLVDWPFGGLDRI